MGCVVGAEEQRERGEKTVSSGKARTEDVTI